MAKYTLLQKLALVLAWVATLTATLSGFAPRSLFLFPVLSLPLISAILLLKHNPKMAGMQTSGSFFSWLGKMQWCQIFPRLENRALVFLAAGLLLYLFINSLWVSEMDRSYRKLLYLLVLLAGWVAWQKVPALLTGLQLWRIVRGIVIGVLVATLYISLELQNGLGLTTFFIETLSPMIELGENNRPGHSLKLPPHYFNSNACALNLLFWPTLMIALAWPKGQYGSAIRKLLPPVLVTGMAVLTFSSHSESAKVALFLAAIGFFLASRYPTAFHKACLAIWTISVVATVPLILLGSSPVLQYGSWLPFSAKDRVHIWHYTAVHVPDNPVLGKGLLSSSVMNNRATAYRKKYPERAKDHPGLHPHNIFLQAWYELGAVGVTFLLFIGIAVLGKISALPPKERPFGYAGFITFFCIAAFGYGLWQTWLLAAYCYSAILFFLALVHRKTSNAT